MSRVLKAVIAGAIVGMVHITIMFLKGMYVFGMELAIAAYIIGSLIIFFVPLGINGWMKGLAVGVAFGLPLSIYIRRFDPAGSVISGMIMPGLLGCLVGLYSYNEHK